MIILFFSLRIALSMIEDAENKGLITPGKVVTDLSSLITRFLYHIRFLYLVQLFLIKFVGKVGDATLIMRSKEERIVGKTHSIIDWSEWSQSISYLSIYTKWECTRWLVQQVTGCDCKDCRSMWMVLLLESPLELTAMDDDGIWPKIEKTERWCCRCKCRRQQP